MTALEVFKAQAAEITQQKADAIKTGKIKSPTPTTRGQTHALYYIGGRWVDNGTRQRIAWQFPHAVEYERG